MFIQISKNDKNMFLSFLSIFTFSTKVKLFQFSRFSSILGSILETVFDSVGNLTSNIYFWIIFLSKWIWALSLV